MNTKRFLSFFLFLRVCVEVEHIRLILLSKETMFTIETVGTRKKPPGYG